MVAHSSLTGTALHEPKGVEAAVAGEVYIADGVGSGAWEPITYLSLPTGSLVNSSRTQTSTYASGTVQIPLDDTIPQSTEGTQFLSITHTPKSVTNRLVVRVVANLALSNSAVFIAALFKDSISSAIAGTVSNQFTSAVLKAGPTVFEYEMTAGTTSAITFKLRAGPTTALTMFFNGDSSGRRLGGVDYSSIEVLEYKA